MWTMKLAQISFLNSTNPYSKIKSLSLVLPSLISFSFYSSLSTSLFLPVPSFPAILLLLCSSPSPYYALPPLPLPPFLLFSSRANYSSSVLFPWLYSLPLQSAKSLKKQIWRNYHIQVGCLLNKEFCKQGAIVPPPPPQQFGIVPLTKGLNTTAGTIGFNTVDTVSIINITIFQM